mmetsp:Transcript_90426/g.189137  ORF Transcript_90426/g.189137 Transcript_90426/m.189137 type:complete len:216 (-) Transcript_90426:4-651(-)
MLNALGFFGGYFVNTLAPCGVSACSGPTIKLTATMQGFLPDDDDKITKAKKSRPYLTMRGGQRQKQTEAGDWDSEEERWRFEEALTIEVGVESEVCIQLMAMQEYDLLVAALDLRPICAGEACFPVSSVLSELVKKKTELDGFVYASPTIGLDLHKDGKKTGRLYLSFETKTPPPQHATYASVWCAPARTSRTDEDEMEFAESTSPLKKEMMPSR